MARPPSHLPGGSWRKAIQPPVPCRCWPPWRLAVPPPWSGRCWTMRGWRSRFHHADAAAGA
ncbi:hypothetical protein ACFQU7_23285 [Pseudoroseomonas wenyumeiae]